MNTTYLFEQCVDLTIYATVIMASAWIFGLLLKRMSAAFRHLYWLLVAFGLLLLPAASFVLPKVSLRILPMPTNSMEESSDQAKKEVGASLGNGVGNLEAQASGSGMASVSRSGLVASAPTSGVPDHKPVSQNRAPLTSSPTMLGDGTMNSREDFSALGVTFLTGVGFASVPSSLLMIWLVGVGVAGLWILAGLLRLRMLVKRSCCSAEGLLQQWCDEATAELGVGRTVKVLESESAFMPMTIGLFRPVLILPASAREWPCDRRRAVLFHELGHVLRRDFLTQFIGRIFCAVYWFHPLSWAIDRRLRAEAEAACDDIAIESGSQPASYAEHLLHIAKFHRGLRMLPASPAIPMAHNSKLEQRLRSILDCKINRRNLSRRSVAFCAAVAVCAVAAVSTLRLSAADPAAEAEEILTSAGAVSPAAETSLFPGEVALKGNLSQAGEEGALESRPIREGGSVESANIVTLRSGVDQSTAIVWIAREGERVAKGDLLLELDSSALVAQLEAREIEDAKAKAELEAARQALQAAKQELETTSDTLAMSYELAKLQRKKAVAEYELQQKNLESELELAKQRFELANSRVAVQEKRVETGAASKDELSADRLRLSEAQSALEEVQRKIESLGKDVGRFEITAAEVAVSKAAGEIVRSRTSGENAVRSAEAELKAIETVNAIKSRGLDRLREQVAACKVYAPFDGLVVYLSEPIRGAGPQRYEPGSVVRRGQSVMRIDAMDKLRIPIYVHVSLIDRAKVGQPVVVKFDALPKEEFAGKVVSVSREPVLLGTGRGLQRYPVPAHKVVISLPDSLPSWVKPGMSVRVEIVEEGK